MAWVVQHVYTCMIEGACAQANAGQSAAVKSSTLAALTSTASE